MYTLRKRKEKEGNQRQEQLTKYVNEFLKNE